MAATPAFLSRNNLFNDVICPCNCQRVNWSDTLVELHTSFRPITNFLQLVLALGTFRGIIAQHFVSSSLTGGVTIVPLCHDVDK